MAEPITGKVARVLSSREVVINRGSEHGVEQGFIFEILDADGSDIEDPDTGKVIGSVNRPKVRVRVTVVEPQLCVAATYRVRRVNVGGTGGLAIPDFGGLLLAPKWVERPETFKSDEAAWEKIPESQSFVKTGDPVRQLITARPEVVEGDVTGSELDPAE